MAGFGGAGLVAHERSVLLLPPGFKRPILGRIFTIRPQDPRARIGMDGPGWRHSEEFRTNTALAPRGVPRKVRPAPRTGPMLVKTSDQHLKIVEWSTEDGCYVDRCPGLFLGGVHGPDEAKVYGKLHETGGRRQPQPVHRPPAR